MEQQQSVEVQQENQVLNNLDFGKAPESETTGNVDFWDLLVELRIG